MPTPTTQTKQQVQAVLIDRKTYTTTLMCILIDHYGTECTTWSPETVQMEIEEDFQVTLPKPNMDRVMAGINLLTSDDFYQSLPDFINFCNILCGDSYDPRTWDPADPTEMAWGITEALLLAPPDEGEDNPFSEEIVAYMGAMLDAEGILTPPDVLQIAMRNTHYADTVNAEFSDDPIMFNSIHDFEQSKTDGINQEIKESLQALVSQLESLQLRNGSTANVIEQIKSSLNVSRKDGAT